MTDFKKVPFVIRVPEEYSVLEEATQQMSLSTADPIIPVAIGGIPSALYVYDKQNHEVHRVGSDPADSLSLDEARVLHYVNLETGLGCTTKEESERYSFVTSIYGSLEDQGTGLYEIKYGNDVASYLRNLEEEPNEQDAFIKRINHLIEPRRLTERGEKGIRRLFDRFDAETLNQALESGAKTYLKYDSFGGEPTPESTGILIEKLGGIAYNMSKTPIEATIGHIAALARSQFLYWDNRVGRAILKDYIRALQRIYSEEEVIDDLSGETLEMTREAKNWTEWRRTMESWTEQVNQEADRRSD